jgi:hypothetical protein
MTNFNETDHPRSDAGAFVDKAQSVPETALHVPTQVAVAYDDARRAVYEAGVDVRTAAFPYIAELLITAYPGAALVSFYTDEGDRQVVSYIVDADGNRLWGNADDTDEAIDDVNDALLDFGDWDTARHILARGDDDNLQLDLLASAPRTGPKSIDQIVEEIDRAAAASIAADKRLFTLGVEGITSVARSFFPTASKLIVEDYNDDGSSPFLNPARLEDADGTTLWEAESVSDVLTDAESLNFLDSLAQYTALLDRDLDAVTVPGRSRHEEPLYAVTIGK